MSPATAPTIPAATSRRRATRRVAQGVTINGLVILSETPLPWNPDHTNPPGGLENYYRNNVIGGPGAFVMVAEDFNSFGQAIIKKMIAEVAQPRRCAGRWRVERRVKRSRCTVRGTRSGTAVADKPNEFIVVRQPFGR